MHLARDPDLGAVRRHLAVCQVDFEISVRVLDGHGRHLVGLGTEGQRQGDSLSAKRPPPCGAERVRSQFLASSNLGGIDELVPPLFALERILRAGQLEGQQRISISIRANVQSASKEACALVHTR